MNDDKQQSSRNVINYNLFCSRHFVEIYKPRCPYCDQLIFDEECTEAEGKAWHIGHFCCTECQRSLGGQQYIMASSEKTEKKVNTSKQLPYCLTCFDILFGELCEECGELIGCEVGAIIHECRSWHATDSCFRCSLCLKSLLGKPFLPALDGRIYCSLTCSQAMISHQKEKLRRQNKLHTLHSHKNLSLLNKPPEPSMRQINEHQANSKILNQSLTNKSIKEQRDQFLKSMTLSRYEQKLKNVHKDYEKIKILNLSQLVNYEKFIKQSNQFFTSKYDWSKEHEFVNTIESNNEMFSSQTTTTTFSDYNSEDNNLAQNMSSKCDLISKSVDLKEFHMLQNQYDDNLITSDSSEMNSENVFISEDKNKPKSLGVNKSDIKLSLVSAQFNSSSQNSDIRFQGTEDSIHLITTQPNLNSKCYFINKQTSSPSSNETSPPPEYSRLGVEFRDENSSLSSSQKLKGINGNSNEKSSGILKIISDSSTEMNQSSDLNIYCQLKSVNKENGCFTHLPNSSYNYFYQSTPLDGKAMENENITKSSVKSVSFDPNIEDKGERPEKLSVRKIRSRYYIHEHEDCSDSHSCSSCSTCSSTSSDDDDDDDFDLINYANNCNNLENKTKTIDSLSNNAKSNNQINNESCTIS